MLAFSILSLASLALSPVSALVIPRKTAPAGWATGYLEDYDTYHTRYLALSCQTQHNTEFFDQCCHPLLATENLQDNRAPQCTPSATASSSAAQSAPTTGADSGEDDGEVDCDDDDSDDGDDQESSSSEPAPEPTTTQEPETSSTQEPETTSSQEPETTSTPESSPSSTEQAPPTETSQSSGGDNGGNSGSESGDGTFYEQGGVAGACGDVNPDSAFIAAVAFDRYGNIGAKSSLCGKSVKVTNTKNGKTVDVTIADACEACAWGSLDLSKGAFDQIATEEEGLVPITWVFN